MSGGGVVIFLRLFTSYTPLWHPLYDLVVVYYRSTIMNSKELLCNYLIWFITPWCQFRSGLSWGGVCVPLHPGGGMILFGDTIISLKFSLKG